MEEIWKLIDGYENYKVSTLGNVMNTDTGKILKGQNNGRGYLHVALYDRNHKCKTIMIHRLVALTFIPNPENLPQVNHIDENKTNNQLDNLEWISSVDNINHGTHNKRVGKNNPLRIPIYSVTKSGDVTYFDSARHAEKYYSENGMNVRCTGISQALKGRANTYKGMAWYPQSDKNGLVDYNKKFNNSQGCWVKIYSVNKYGKIERFANMQIALRFYDLPRYQSTYLKMALENETEFNGLRWYYDK